MDTPKFGGYEPWSPFGIPCNQPITAPEATAVKSSVPGMFSWVFKNSGTPTLGGVPHASPDVSTGDLALNRFKTGNTQNCKLTQTALVESDQWNPPRVHFFFVAIPPHL